MRIRQYVVNQVANTNGRAGKIMSERDLCKRFSVARGTARKALEDLVKEGYLVPKRGMGTFINPKKSAGYRVQVSNKVGVILSSGMLVNITQDYQRALMGVFEVFSSRNVAVQLVNFPARTARDTFQDVAALGFDGLLWLHPPTRHPGIVDYFFAHTDALVTVGPFARPGWKHVVLDDYQEAMLAGAAELIKSAGAEVVFVGRDDRHPEARQLYAAFEELFAARGLKRPPEFTIAANRLDQPFRQLLRTRHPRAIYSQGGEFGQAAMAALRGEADALPDGCRFLCQDAPEMAKLPGQVEILRIPRPDHYRQGQIAGELLMDVMRPAGEKPALPRLVKLARAAPGAGGSQAGY